MPNFGADFVLPAIRGLSPADAQRVGRALDVAVTFGMIQALEGNTSGLSLEALHLLYQQKVAELREGAR